MILVSYPKRIMARTHLNTREFQIIAKNEKRQKDERKSQIKYMNPGGQLEDSGLHSHTKTQKNTTTNFPDFLDLSHELEANPKRERRK
jgi:hypothetical protein